MYLRLKTCRVLSLCSLLLPSPASLSRPSLKHQKNLSFKVSITTK